MPIVFSFMYLSAFRFHLFLEENKVIHKYNTRQKDDFHIDAIKLEIGKRSIKYKGSKLWNDLPAELKQIQSLQSFKYKLKNYSLQSLTYVTSSKVLHLHLPPCLIVSVFLSAC